MFSHCAFNLNLNNPKLSHFCACCDAHAQMELTAEVSKRMVAEQLLSIVQQDLAEQQLRVSMETTARVKVENELVFVKVSTYVYTHTHTGVWNVQCCVLPLTTAVSPCIPCHAKEYTPVSVAACPIVTLVLLLLLTPPLLSLLCHLSVFPHHSSAVLLPSPPSCPTFLPSAVLTAPANGLLTPYVHLLLVIYASLSLLLPDRSETHREATTGKG